MDLNDKMICSEFDNTVYTDIPRLNTNSKENNLHENVLKQNIETSNPQNKIENGETLIYFLTSKNGRSSKKISPEIVP